MIKEKLEKAIKEAIKNKFSVETEDGLVEHPADMALGDYATSAPLKLASILDRNPKEIAEELAEELKKNKPGEIEKMEPAGPGFVNFFLSSDFFESVTKKILKKKGKWGANSELKGRKIMLEYTDPNPFKEMHIGHLMSNAIGESVSRIVEFSGARTKRVNYQGDVGLHVAKVIWGLRQLELSPELENLGKAYAKGDDAYKNSEEAQVEINELNRKVYAKEESIKDEYERGREVSLDHFEQIYRKLGTEFDSYFFESQTADKGAEIVRKFAKKGVFEESDGALIFRGESYGLHTRVFINSEGLPTYEAKELALAKIKHEEFSYDDSIIFTAEEQEEYFKVVRKAMELIYPELAASTYHIPHGMMQLPRGKISSRSGSVPTGEGLIKKVAEAAAERVKRGDKNTAEEVAVGAIKYSILKRATGKNVIFDVDQALSFEGDSGPYLQYSLTRARSVLEKAKKEKVTQKPKKQSNKNFQLEKMLYKFPEVVERALNEHEPQHITNYLTNLCAVFNSFYSTEKIVNKEDKDSSYRVALTKAFEHTLENGLWLLGIPTPERM